MEDIIKVIIMNNLDNKYELKIKDSDIKFYVNETEIHNLDPKKEYGKIGSSLKLKIKEQKIVDISFDIFSYNQNWENNKKELEDILREIKLK